MLLVQVNSLFVCEFLQLYSVLKTTRDNLTNLLLDCFLVLRLQRLLLSCSWCCGSSWLVNHGRWALQLFCWFSVCSLSFLYFLLRWYSFHRGFILQPSPFFIWLHEFFALLLEVHTGRRGHVLIFINRLDSLVGKGLKSLLFSVILLPEVMFFVFDGNLIELGTGLIIESRHGFLADKIFLRSEFLHFFVLHHEFYFFLHLLGLLLFVNFCMVCPHRFYFYLWR